MRGLSAGDFSGGEIVRDGSAVVGPPGEQEFWVAESSGVGTRTVTWSVEPGEWTVVVANSDGSAGVQVTVEAGAEVPALPLVAGSLLIAGVLLLVLGGALIALPISRTAGSRSEVRTV